MKTIGIIGAMQEEIAYIKPKMNIVTVRNIIGLDFFIGKFNNTNVVLVRSGIGKVNAAICSQVLIDLFAVDYIINTGVAGAISKELDIGDVVISDEVWHHDVDVTAFGHKMGVIPRMPDSAFRADEELIRLATEATKNVPQVKNVLTGKIVSGDQFISSAEIKNKIKENFNPLCVEMESAAIAQTCVLNKIPFVIIRAISDKADGSADMSFEEFVDIAARNASNIVENIMEQL